MTKGKRGRLEPLARVEIFNGTLHADGDRIEVRSGDVGRFPANLSFIVRHRWQGKLVRVTIEELRAAGVETRKERK